MKLCQFVINSHKVMTTLIFVVPSKCCLIDLLCKHIGMTIVLYVRRLSRLVKSIVQQVFKKKKKSLLCNPMIDTFECPLQLFLILHFTHAHHKECLEFPLLKAHFHNLSC
jgi:hypothetical protein